MPRSTKKSLTLIFACLFTSLFTIPAHAQRLQWDTGNDLLAGFHDCDAKYLSNTLTDKFIEQDENCQFLRGYIAGVRGALSGLDIFAIPEGVTNGQIWDVIRHYLESHPESRQQAASLSIATALRLAWPASKQ
jgi:hypothetical protein